MLGTTYEQIDQAKSRLGLEIERRGRSRTPLAMTFALCCCMSCSSCKK